MKFIELVNNLKSQIKNLYLIKGDDIFVIDSAIKHISNACIKEYPDFNKIIITDENFNINFLDEAIQSLPIGADRRLVILKHINKLTENDKKNIKKIIQNIPDQTTIIIVYNDNWKFLKDVESVDCGKQNFDIIFKYIKYETQKQNLNFSDEIVKTLIELCSFNMTKINMELKKLMAFNNENLLTINDLKNIVDEDHEYQIFELSENLGNKNATKSLKILSELIQKKEPLQNIFAMLLNHFRRIIHSGLSDLSTTELSKLFDVKEYAIIKAKQQSKYFSKIQLKNILFALEDIDFMVKNGKMTQENALFYTVFQILYC